jgi:hypothetical protein
MLLFILNSFLFAHSCEEFVVRLSFLHSKNVIDIKRNLVEQ